MATHSSILAWRIPWTEEPSRLQTIRVHAAGFCSAQAALLQQHLGPCDCEWCSIVWLYQAVRLFACLQAM